MEMLNVTSANVSTNISEDTTLSITSAPSLCGADKNQTASGLILERMFSKHCAGTSIPMGTGTGVLVFIAVIILVNHLMRREDKKATNYEMSREKRTVSPVPSYCMSLLLADGEVKSTADLYPEVFLNEEPATLTKNTEAGSAATNTELASGGNTQSAGAEKVLQYKVCSV